MRAIRSLSDDWLRADVLGLWEVCCVDFVFLAGCQVGKSNLGGLASRNHGASWLRWQILYYQLWHPYLGRVNAQAPSFARGRYRSPSSPPLQSSS